MRNLVVSRMTVPNSGLRRKERAEIPQFQPVYPFSLWAAHQLRPDAPEWKPERVSGMRSLLVAF